ncbi:L-histidine N(alpha)-methyltransferase [Synechococcus sp. MIT S9504]|uniref:L-histidine N(alpha)-methyltransferase n=1 Tax=Synechococcus sp. MIT S9504 TaxID=1801628 RepID=UPI0007BC2DE6|nr:L-histidine N(alpha)-methyltransferase [Synechococcus sp. MIT S9504]KZR84427.1 Histidine-specific methyltransferase EgtD [Synechococcus sp. MIT S9504]
MTTQTPARPQLIDLHPPNADMQRLVHNGLQREPRQLPAWFLYDQEGSRLFDQICEQPEYSLTRTEISLLESSAADIARAIGSGVIVEFGAGSARKVGPLLEAMQPSAYVALDISADHLRQSMASLQAQHPCVPMLGICCDHSQLDALPDHPLIRGERRVGFFPGSSLGNFTRAEAIALLRRFRRLLDGGPLLLGLDQPKSRSRLEAAYNDAAGISAAFAHNLLQRLNNDLGADFNPDNFLYEAVWQETESRVRMALISEVNQTVSVGGEPWTFSLGQPLVTEYSVKYSAEMARELAKDASWHWRHRWHDPADDLSLHWLEAAD